MDDHPLELRRFGGGEDTLLVLAHGAGQGMDSPFMERFGAGLAQRGLGVVQFEFDYMRAARAAGKRKPPDREPKLLACWRSVVATLRESERSGRLLIGGKSMGGRMASLVADELAVDGLVCLGYPFHPPGKPERTRTAHLEALATPTLVCQGERDPFGNRDDVAGYSLAAGIEVLWLGDGDHGFKPRKSSGLTEAGNHELAMDAIVRFAGVAAT